MKRLVLSILILCSCLFVQAQTQVTTYSSCDSNTNGTVNVEDVTNTVNKVLAKTANDQNVVTAEQLNTILSEINAKLDKLEKLELWMQSISYKVGAQTAEEYEKYNGHEFVDLGLSVKWATCNVGASKPEDYGLYFSWGDTKGYSQDTGDGHVFDWANYKWCNGSISSLTKYCTSSSSGVVDNLTSLEAADDAATVNWGGVWRTPTDAELTELNTKCTWTWTTEKDVPGYKVTAANGNFIFLPAAGVRDGSILNNEPTHGCYWSSTLSDDHSYDAYELGFYSTSTERCGRSRFYGRSIRPVCQ